MAGSTAATDAGTVTGRSEDVGRVRSIGAASESMVSAVLMMLLTLLVAVAVPASAGARSEYVWPLDPRPRVVRAFAPGEQNWLRGHRGVDLEATSGRPVYAAGVGRVLFAGRVGGKPVVSIDHGNGLRTTYEPVLAEVRRGDRVAAGTAIGTLEAGHPDCPVSACLHLGLLRGRTYLDPLGLFGGRRIVLRPDVEIGVERSGR